MQSARQSRTSSKPPNRQDGHALSARPSDGVVWRRAAEAVAMISELALATTGVEGTALEATEEEATEEEEAMEARGNTSWRLDLC